MVSHFGLPVRHTAATSPAAAALSNYLRTVEVVVRGPRGVAVAFAVLLGAGALGGRAGLALAGGYLLFIGSYCVLNFWHCRETHCVMTGPGWTAAALLALAAALVPGTALAWYTVNSAGLATLVVFLAGYGLEWLVAARTGRRRIG